MRIINYRCKNIYGYISQNISFFEDVNFLHGINGCGKTTVIRSIIALLTPDFTWLVNNNYELIQLKIEHEGKKYTLSVSNINKKIIFKVAIGSKNRYEDSFDLQNIEYFIEEFEPSSPTDYRYVLEEIKDAGSNGAVNIIDKLPTPLFLGLERTAIGSSKPAARLSSRRPQKAIIRDNRTSPDESLHQAERLIRDHMNSISERRANLIADLRDRLITSIFQLQENSYVEGRFPDRETVVQFEELRFKVVSTLKTIGFKDRAMEEYIVPFFDKLISTARIFFSYKNHEEFIQKNRKDLMPLIEWYKVSQRIPVINNIAYLIDEFNNNDSELRSIINRYLRIMDNFVQDSGKSIRITNSGETQIILPSGDIGTSDAFSSGERQLFVLISHLMFNEDASRANLLLIDEPELSLHMKWQEQFVDSILDATPGIQLLLATHSPSIINRRTDNTILVEQEA